MKLINQYNKKIEKNNNSNELAKIQDGIEMRV